MVLVCLVVWVLILFWIEFGLVVWLFGISVAFCWLLFSGFGLCILIYYCLLRFVIYLLVLFRCMVVCLCLLVV